MSEKTSQSANYYCTTNREVIRMTRNKKLVPEAKAALDKFKMECASEVGVAIPS